MKKIQQTTTKAACNELIMNSAYSNQHTYEMTKWLPTPQTTFF